MPSFDIELHKRDLHILQTIQSYFGGGTIHIRSNRNEAAVLTITEIKVLQDKIIPHFIKYPLVTQKRADFELFVRAVKLISEKKKHLTKEGLREIVALRFAKATKISPELLASLPDVSRSIRPL